MEVQCFHPKGQWIMGDLGCPKIELVLVARFGVRHAQAETNQ